MGDALDESNEGFKMLKAMGWKEGSGLGKAEKGSVLPLSATLPEAEGRLGLGKATEEETMTSNAAKERRRLDSEIVETEDRKRKREAEAARHEDLEAQLRAQNREFYCECCDKQYKTVAEFSVHLSSYDHHHRKRFAEMREAEKARNADATAEKRSREEARRERELQKQIRAAQAAPAPAPEAPAPAALPGFGGFQTKKIAGAAPIKFSLDFGKKL